MRRSVSLLAAFVLTFSLATAGSAQSEEPSVDGRFEIPEFGYAITFPHDWVVGRIDQLVQAFAPEDEDRSRVGCNMQFGEGFGMSAETALSFIESDS
jgi:hypothetical protein